MSKFPQKMLALALAVVSLVPGCATGSRQAEQNLIARHPIYETRMSHVPEEGYLPSGVWRIRGEQNTVYLAGTSHVVADDQIPFPSPFYAAYRDSKEVYV